MLVRFSLSILLACISSVSFAQSCYKSLSLSQPCAGSASFKAAASNCTSGLYVSVGNSTAACQSPSALASSIGNLCANQCSPPAPVYSSSFISAVISQQVTTSNLNLVKVTWAKDVRNVSTCATTKAYNVAVLDKTKGKNAIYLASYPANATIFSNVKLICPSSTWVTTKDSAGNTTVTYPAGCYVDSYSAASKPAIGMCYMQYL
jgi:hypothetical protein